MKALLSVLILNTATAIASPTEFRLSEKEYRTNLSVANTAGMCNTVFDLIEFQEKNRIDGGDKLIMDFLTAKIETLGENDVEEFLKKCLGPIELHNETIVKLYSE